MEETARQNLDAVWKSVKVNLRVVRKKLSKSGAPRALIFSTAKYYATIEKLAKE